MNPVYITSSACHGAGNCVEVALLPSGGVAVRDSKTGRTLEFTPDEWDTFLKGVRAGEFNRDALPRAGVNPPEDLSCHLCRSLEHTEMECPTLDSMEPLSREEMESMALYADECCELGERTWR